MVEQELTTLITNNLDAIKDKKRFVALLKDTFAQDLKELNLIKTLYEMGIAEDIEKTISISNSFGYRYVSRLIEEYGTTRLNADWAVAIWCVCYGQKVLHKECDISLTNNDGRPMISEEANNAGKQYRDLFTYSPCMGGFQITGFKGTYTQTIVLPNSYMNKKVIAVADGAFEGSDVEEVVMTEGITILGKRSFAECKKLKQIVMVEGLKEISAECFMNSEALSIINIPYSVDFVGEKAFWGVGIREITLLRPIYCTQRGVFSHCKKLIRIVIPNNTTVIPDEMFKECSALRKVEIPETVSQIGNEVFKDCTELDLITIPDNVKQIGEDVFDNTHHRIIVQCSQGSYTEQYCRSRLIKYQLV